jgi:hypothetical protein
MEFYPNFMYMEILMMPINTTIKHLICFFFHCIFPPRLLARLQVTILKNISPLNCDSYILLNVVPCSHIQICICGQCA